MEPDINVRHWRLDDLDSLVEYAANFNVARYMRDLFPHPYSEEAGRTFIQGNIETDPATTLAVTWNDEAIGSIAVMPRADIHRMNAEIGYWIGEPFWGKGVLSKVIPKMVKYGFETFDIDRIFATVSHVNLASQRVLQKSGFTLEARLEKTLIKLGERHDELIFGIRKE